MSLSTVATGVAPGSYQATSEVAASAGSVAHRFAPIQLVVEIWPEH